MNGNSCDTEDAEQTPEQIYKIIVVGTAGTGKTSFLQRYIRDFFSEGYKTTIGVDFMLKTLDWDNPKMKITLQFWDIAGQEKFGHMLPLFYREASGALVVYDVTRDGTFADTVFWSEDIVKNVGKIPMVLLANKCDLLDGDLDHDAMKAFCEQHGFVDWLPTSSKTNKNLTEAVLKLTRCIVEECEGLPAAGIKPKMDLASQKNQTTSKQSGGCCN